MELQLIADNIYPCLVEKDSECLEALYQILYCEGWEHKDQEGKIDLEFQTPLRHVRLDCSKVVLLDEWRDLIQFTQQDLSPTTTKYLGTWRLILPSSSSRQDFRNTSLFS